MEKIEKAMHPVREVVGCRHLKLDWNPLRSLTTPNVGVGATGSFVLVVEEYAVKLICWDCLKTATKLISPQSILAQ